MDAGRAAGEWRRAAVLLLAALVFSVTDPVALVLPVVAVVWLAHCARDPRAVFLALAALAVGGWAASDSPVLGWERGWPLLVAGAFLWVDLRRPRWPLTARALAGVALAGAAAALVFAVWPGGWRQLDAEVRWAFRQRADEFLARGLDPAVRDRIEPSVRTAVEWAASLFPGSVALASMAALGLAEFVRRRWQGAAGRALPPLREFRFDDHWIWCWIAGLALVVAPVGPVFGRLGANAVFVFGALYALRGLGVLAALLAGRPPAVAWLGALVAVLLLPILWVLLLGALALGLSDTWWDLRARWARARRP